MRRFEALGYKTEEFKDYYKLVHKESGEVVYVSKELERTHDYGVEHMRKRYPLEKSLADNVSYVDSQLLNHNKEIAKEIASQVEATSKIPRGLLYGLKEPKSGLYNFSEHRFSNGNVLELPAFWTDAKALNLSPQQTAKLANAIRTQTSYTHPSVAKMKAEQLAQREQMSRLWEAIGGAIERMKPKMDINKARDTLGVSRSATDLEIKAKYHELAKKNHPDQGGSNEKMVEINSAYEELSKYFDKP